jgi:hypothetical protein
MTFLRRLLYLLRNRRMEAEFAEELETHRLLAQQRELQAGAADAAAASRRVMGNVTLAREDARAQWIAPWLDSVWQDGMYALRGFRRAPAFTGAFVLVMALGVGATTAVFTVAHAVLLESLPYPDSTQLVRLWKSIPAGNRWLSLWTRFAWRDRSLTLEDAGAYGAYDYLVRQTGIEPSRRARHTAPPSDATIAHHAR